MEKQWHNYGHSWKSIELCIELYCIYIYKEREREREREGAYPCFCIAAPSFVSWGLVPSVKETNNAQSLTLNIIYCRWKTDQHFSLTPVALAGSELKVFTVSSQDASVLSVLISPAPSLTHTHTQKHKLVHLFHHSYSQFFIQRTEHLIISVRHSWTAWRAAEVWETKTVRLVRVELPGSTNQCPEMLKEWRKHVFDYLTSENTWK